jgi:hypothetical protein
MKKTVINRPLLQLLVSVYNKSIQTYFYFPDVILCGHQRLDADEFAHLLSEGLIGPYKADSFGRFYRLTKKGEDYLFQESFRRRTRPHQLLPDVQGQFPFAATRC